jgi:hypothetical protein
MPSPFYNTEGPVGLRKLEGASKVHDIGIGFEALGSDVEGFMVAQALAERSESLTAKPGELVLMTAASKTVTLPSPKLNTTVGVFSAAGGTIVKRGPFPLGCRIYGGAISGAETIELATNQCAILRGDENNWRIIAGEPKLEQSYGALTARTSGTEYEPSATRLTFVTITMHNSSNGTGGIESSVYVGGVEIASPGYYPVAADNALQGSVSYSFFVPPGQKWKAEVVATADGSAELKSSYLTL